jgi:SET domain-containing protein
MSKKFKIAPSKTGFGLFAARPYKPNEQIMEILGNLVHWRTLLDLTGVIQDNAFRYSDEYYLSPSGAGNYINHSCTPNAGVFKQKNKIVLKAIIPIKSGTQITFDYSTIIGGDDEWIMRCQCRARKCRKFIKSFTSLPQTVQRRYLSLGVVPEYILRT